VLIKETEALLLTVSVVFTRVVALSINWFKLYSRVQNYTSLQLLIGERWPARGCRRAPCVRVCARACVCVCCSVCCMWGRERRSCTHWHGLAAVEGADCSLSLGVCGELDKGATWKRGNAHHTHNQVHTQARTHSIYICTVNAFNRASLKAHGILIKDVELYSTPQKSLCSERLWLHSGPPHCGH